VIHSKNPRLKQPKAKPPTITPSAIEATNGNPGVMSLPTPKRHRTQTLSRALVPLSDGILDALSATLFAMYEPGVWRLTQYPPRELIQYPPRELTQSTVRLPTISLVTPSFQQGTFLERTIQSIRWQNYPYLEYIVQDGGSTDRTLDILERHKDLLASMASQSDRGQAHAINLGFARSSGEIMGWLNSDDMLCPGALHLVGSFFARQPQVDVVYGHRILIDGLDREIGRWILPPHDSEILSWADLVPQESLFWRRSVWDRIGGALDESFAFAVDWDLLLRFRDVGARFMRVPHFLGAFRVHDAQKTSAQLRSLGAQEIERIRRRIHARHVSSSEVHYALRNYFLRAWFLDLGFTIIRQLAFGRHRTVALWAETSAPGK
jgi:glycosyltransferase involved in cell wall biosynthesis